MRNKLNLIQVALKVAAAIRSKNTNSITRRHITMRHKILTAFFVLVTVVPQIYTPAYADKAQDKALFSAAQKGDVDEVKHLLAAGVKVNAESKAGEQAIHYAAHYGNNVELVKALLAEGAKADALNAGGYQPIHLAAQSGNVEIVQALLAAGAKIDAKTANRYGAQPIHFAAQSGNAELVKILLAAGAKPDAKSNDGDTPFSYIQNNGDPDLVKNVLLAAGAKKVQTRIEKLRAEMGTNWLEVTDPQIKLGVWDKNNFKETFNARYVVKCESGTTFVAERAVTSSNPESSNVMFPNDFHLEKKGLESYKVHGCGEGRHGMKLIWSIYADDVLIDSGTMIFTRKASH